MHRFPTPLSQASPVPGSPVPARAAGGRLSTLVWLVLAFLLCAEVTAGCQALPPRLLPWLETRPDPDLAAQATLIRDARRHVEGGRAEAAVQVLVPLIERHPDSLLLPEMRWWLGRAYELAGDDEAAGDLYRRLIIDTPATEASQRRLIGLAQRRLAALTPNPAPGESQPISGLLVAPTDVPAGTERAAWLDALSRDGITMLVVNAASPPGDAATTEAETVGQEQVETEPHAGVYFRTSWAPVIDDLFEQLVPMAHERGLSVHAALSLRRLSWLEPPAGWADVSFDLERKALEPTLALDLFHPGYQQYLEGLLLDLVDSGVDGVIFRATHPLGPTDGFSPFAQQAFERAFAFPVEPHRWFRDGRPAPGDDAPDDRLIFESPDRHPPGFWRWAGWKSRERLAVMTRLAEAIRAHRADVTVSLELHAATVLDPIAALVAYAEDVVEVARAPFDHVLVPFRVTASPPAASTGPDARAPAVNGRLAALIELAGDPSRIWLVRAVDAPTLATVGHPRAFRVDHPAIPRAVGILAVPSHATLP